MGRTSDIKTGDNLDDWEKSCSNAINEATWVENQAQSYMKNLSIEILNDALVEQEVSQVMVDAYKHDNWNLLGSCVANLIEKECYALAELDWLSRPGD